MTDAARVLIVDDEPNIRLTLRTMLESAGIVVEEAADGASALAAFLRAPFDAVVLDLRMPGMDGLEVLRRLRAHHPSVPVVVVTAHGTVDAAVEAMKDGAYDFLQKPFDPVQIRDVVRRMLRGEPPPHVEALPPAVSEFESLLAAARRACREQHPDAAEQFARRALVLAPDRPESFHLLGVVQDVLRQRVRAQVYYRTALALDPRYGPSDANLDRLVTGSTSPLLYGDESPPRRR